MIIDQFEQNCAVSEAMEQFAARHFGEPRKVDKKTIRPDGCNGTVFGLKDGVRTYRIININGVWIVNLWEPTT